MKFKQKDELGIERIYYVITNVEIDGEILTIYTDLVPEEDNDFRILVGKVINNKVVRLEKTKEDDIKNKYKNLEQGYLNILKEQLQ